MRIRGLAGLLAVLLAVQSAQAAICLASCDRPANSHQMAGHMDVMAGHMQHLDDMSAGMDSLHPQMAQASCPPQAVAALNAANLSFAAGQTALAILSLKPADPGADAAFAELRISAHTSTDTVSTPSSVLRI